ncbi:MAG TPA: hypothetical protein VGN00_19340 [Puia sp.]|jgi:hypothetical protein
MEQLNIQEADWIAEGLLPRDADDGRFVVGNCIPAGFEGYAKMFHPFRLDEAAVGWKEVGERYGVVFDKESSIDRYARAIKEKEASERLEFPIEGQLPLAVLTTLLEVLKPYTASGRVCIFQTPPHSIFRGGNTGELVELGLDEVPGYFTKYFTGYLFSVDRSWIVFTDTDLDFTIVGGSAQLISSYASAFVSAFGLLYAVSVDISWINIFV